MDAIFMTCGNMFQLREEIVIKNDVPKSA